MDENCVYKANGDVEAQLVKAFLAAKGIPCEFRGEALRMTHGFTLNGLGVVRICVREQDFEQATDLLARAESGEWSIPDQAEMDAADPS